MSVVIAYERANPLQKAIRSFAGTGPGSWVFAKTLQRSDAVVYRLSSGRRTFANLASGLPVVHLTTTGARSGQERTVPLLGLPTSDGMAVIASNFGQARHPAWMHNLRAEPRATVTQDGERRPVRAREAEGEERARIWRAGLDMYPGWAYYERKAAHRDIAVFVLEPATPVGAAS